MDTITKDLVKKLAQEKLNLLSPVSVKRDYVQDENCYVYVSQNDEFKFHILCSSDPQELEKTEDSICEILEEMGHKVSRKYLN